MTPNQPAVEAELNVFFEDHFDAIAEADTGVPPNHITELMARFNAAVTDPASQSIGGFAQTLQMIQSELHMMAGSLGLATPSAHHDVDWEAILSAADAMGGAEAQAVDFTQDELVALTVA